MLRGMRKKGWRQGVGEGRGDDMEGMMEEGIAGPVDDTIKVRRGIKMRRSKLRNA